VHDEAEAACRRVLQLEDDSNSMTFNPDFVWLPKCIAAICDKCEVLDDSFMPCLNDITKGFNTDIITRTDPKETCSKDTLDYGASACYSELLENCQVTEEWLDTCIQDVCAASNAGDPDPISLAEGYCDNQLVYEEEERQLTDEGRTTTTTTWTSEVGDSSDWKNNGAESCMDYEEKGWCKDGAFVEGFESKGKVGDRCSGDDCGLKFNYPGLNCAVCGKDKHVACYEFDWNYKGADLDPSNDKDAQVGSPQACQLLCQADAACKFFLWNVKSGVCMFKSSVGKRKISNNRRLVAGAEYCVPPLEDTAVDCVAWRAPDEQSKCRFASGFEQCEAYGKSMFGSSTVVKHLDSLTLVKNLQSGDQFPKSCFMSTVSKGGAVQMWWNKYTGDGNAAPTISGTAYQPGEDQAKSARRICCGSHVLLPTPAPTPAPPVLENPDGNPSDPPLNPEVDNSVVVERPANPVSDLCQVYGDPHMVAFDFSGGKSHTVGFYAYGNYWLVKSPALWIQGCYKSIDLYQPGLAYLTKIAAGGPFLQGNTLMVEGTDAGMQVWWNGALIFQGVTTGTHREMNGAVVVERSVKGSGRKQKHKVQVMLPNDVKLNFVAFTKTGKVTFLNGIIKMLQVKGQDGQCGNFNGDPNDDTKEMIEQRGFGNTVSSEQLLIPR